MIKEINPKIVIPNSGGRCTLNGIDIDKYSKRTLLKIISNLDKNIKELSNLSILLSSHLKFENPNCVIFDKDVNEDVKKAINKNMKNLQLKLNDYSLMNYIKRYFKTKKFIKEHEIKDYIPDKSTVCDKKKKIVEK